MFNLFDMLQSQNGQNMQSFGQQFGLSPDQTRRAMETLLPALTLGLQRSAANDPTGFGRFLGLMTPDLYGGAQPQNPMQPDMLFGQIFGSPLVSQAVLQQAAAASGIGTQALKQMLPVMAGMVVAGIVHVMINQQPPAPAAAPRQAPPSKQPASFPVANLWSDWMEGFLGAGNAEDSRKKAEPERRPYEKAAPPMPPPSSERPAAAKAAPAGNDASFEGLQEMLQTGIQVQEQNVRAMQDMFEAFWSAQNAPKAAAVKPQEEAAPNEPHADATPVEKRVATSTGKTLRKIK